MNYTMEYINDNDDIEILRYDSVTKTFTIFFRTGGNYDPPDQDTVFFSREIEADLSGGRLEQLADFHPQIEAIDCWRNIPAYEFVAELKRSDGVVDFMEFMIDQAAAQQNDDKSESIKYYNTAGQTIN